MRLKLLKKAISFFTALAVAVCMIPLSDLVIFAEPDNSTVSSIVCGEVKVLTTEINSGRGVFSFVPEKDGTYAFYSFDNNGFDTYGTVLNADMQELTSDNDSANDRNFYIDFTMNEGETYYLSARPYSNNSTGKYSVKVIELSPLTSLEIVSLPDNINCIGGFSFNYSGLKLKAETADGTSDEWSYSSAKRFLAGRKIYINDTYQDGNYSETVITCGDKTAAFSFNIIANPVDHIELVSASKYTYIENENGEFRTRINPETEEEEEFFYYYRRQLDDAVIKIVYKNGDSETANIGSVVNGYSIYFTDNQYNKPWTVGSDNYITVSYLGSTLQMPVTVVPNPVDHIELVSASKYTYIENVNGEFRTRINPETGEEEEYFYYYRWQLEDAVIKIVYKNGNSETANIGSVVNGYSINFTDNQYNKPWTVGGDNYITVSYLGSTVQMPVTVAPNPVERIELVSASDHIYVENADGEFRTRFNPETGEEEEFFYYDSWHLNDAVIKIVYKNGDSETANIGSVVNRYNIYSNDNQYNKPWTVGGDNFITVSYFGSTLQMPVTVVPNPVDHIELVSASKNTYIENVNGEFRTRINPETGEEEKYFYYYRWQPDDAVIKIVYKNGDSKITNISNQIDGYYVYYPDNQDNEPWTVGSDNYITISYLGSTVQMPVTVAPNPIERIELVSASDHIYVENADGEFITRTNPETGEEEEFFHYDSWHLNDAVIKIVYKNGDSETANIGSVVNGYSIYFTDNQYNKPWTVGSDNYITFFYIGSTLQMPVTIVPNPVDHIELVSASEYTYIENVNGEFRTRTNPETGEEEEFFFYYPPYPGDAVIKIVYKNGTSKTANVSSMVDEYFIDYNHNQYNKPWTVGSDNYITISYLCAEVQIPVTVTPNPVDYIEINSAPTREYIYGDVDFGYYDENGNYHLYPNDFTGLSFTVHYKDGSHVTFSHNDIDEKGKINGYNCQIALDNFNQEIGDNKVTFSYMGKSADYTVKLKKSSVASIELVKAPDKTGYSNWFDADFIGAEFKITFTDGLSTLVTVTEENSFYKISEYGNPACCINVNGYTLMIEPVYGEEGLSYRAYYLGQMCIIDCIDFKGGEEVTSLEIKNFSPDGDGMVVTVTYAGGKTQTLTLNTVFFKEYVDWSSGYARTSEGIMHFSIECYYKGATKIYSVYMLGTNVEIEEETALIGDINKDGIIDIRDLVRLKKIVAGLTNEGTDVADLDGNGRVESADLIIMRKYLLGIDVNIGGGEVTVTPANSI